MQVKCTNFCCWQMTKKRMRIMVSFGTVWMYCIEMVANESTTLKINNFNSCPDDRGGKYTCSRASISCDKPPASTHTKDSSAECGRWWCSKLLLHMSIHKEPKALNTKYLFAWIGPGNFHLRFWLPFALLLLPMHLLVQECTLYYLVKNTTCFRAKTLLLCNNSETKNICTKYWLHMLVKYTYVRVFSIISCSSEKNKYTNTREWYCWRCIAPTSECCQFSWIER